MEKKLSIQEIYVSPPFLRIDAVLRRLCRLFAASGGIILVGLTLVTVASILGRVLFNTPIPGDFELVELGGAIAVSAFLPYCQIQEGNVIVDLVTAKAPKRVNHLLGALGDLLFLGISALICWRLVHGCLDYREYEEITMVLQIPIWWVMPPIIVSFALLALTCASTMLNHLFASIATESARETSAVEAVVPAPTRLFSPSGPERSK